MASAVATDNLFCKQKMEMFYHAPADAATEQSAKAGDTTEKWFPLRDYAGFAVMAMTALKTGNGMIELSIYAAEDDSGTYATEIKTSGAIAADTVGNYAVLEASVAEIVQIGKAAGYNFTHATAYIDCHHNDDEVAVVQIGYGPRFPQDGLTANDLT